MKRKNRIKEIKVDPKFRTSAIKSVLLIALFFTLYLVLSLLSLGLTVFCIYLGITLVNAHPTLITIIFGLGLVQFGFFILVFLTKFLFKPNYIDTSNFIRLRPKDEPELFKLIREVVKEVGTDVPKDVYLSAEVNAGVFYDSCGIGTMFSPTKKNLQIGLGLINCLTKVELKAVLAHEFGHFSQKTMKVGSYVYNANQLIFELLRDNEESDRIVENWANVNIILGLFVALAKNIMNAIKWLLAKVYEILNRSYLGLSREMEFHADEIAANITGHNHLKKSLLRFKLADHSLNCVFAFYDSKFEDNLRSRNVFKEQSFVMNHLAIEDDIPIKNSLPQVSLGSFNKFNKSKLVITDQWASHPSTEERVNRLEELNIPSINTDVVLANELFVNIEETQMNFTNFIFSKVKYENEEVLLEYIEFEREFKLENEKNNFPRIFNGYYDTRNSTEFNLEKIDFKLQTQSFEDLFSNEKINLTYSSFSIQSDVELLEAISNGSIKLKSFDYDGQKYKAKEAINIKGELEKELSDITKRLEENDIEIYKYFKELERNRGENKLNTKYEKYFEYSLKFNEKSDLFNKIMDQLEFVSVITPFEEILEKFNNIKPLEAKIKKEISFFLSDELFSAEIESEVKLKFEKYLEGDLIYFEGETYNDENLEVLVYSINSFIAYLSKMFFYLKRDLLCYQENLLA